MSIGFSVLLFPCVGWGTAAASRRPCSSAQPALPQGAPPAPRCLLLLPLNHHRERHHHQRRWRCDRGAAAPAAAYLRGLRDLVRVAVRDLVAAAVLERDAGGGRDRVAVAVLLLVGGGVRERVVGVRVRVADLDGVGVRVAATRLLDRVMDALGVLDCDGDELADDEGDVELVPLALGDWDVLGVPVRLGVAVCEGVRVADDDGVPVREDDGDGVPVRDCVGAAERERVAEGDAVPVRVLERVAVPETEPDAETEAVSEDDGVADTEDEGDEDGEPVCVGVVVSAAV